MPDCAEVMRQLSAKGLLLLQDQKLPSVVGIITGGPLAGSWWSHARSHDIFQCLEQLDENDVAMTRLISSKVTFVHRSLWPALVAVGMAEEPWQRRGLTAEARGLLGRIARHGSAQAHGPAARELQNRLVVCAGQVHTKSGAHAIRLESWSSWAKRQKVVPLSEGELGRQKLEEAAEKIGARSSSLPWYPLARAARNRK